VSAPKTHDPVVVNTRDGACWERRAVTDDGRGLYAVEGSCKCPEYLLVPLSELARHGIVGQAFALPMPVGPDPSPLERRQLRVDEVERAYTFDTAELKRRVGEAVATVARQAQKITELERIANAERARVAALEAAAYGDATVRLLSPVEQIRHLHACVAAQLSRADTLDRLCREQRAQADKATARVAELEAERHSTNEALSEAAEALRADRDRIAELEEWKAADEKVRPHRVAIANSNLHYIGKLELRIRRARVLHLKHSDSEHCQHDGEAWPCPTVAALEAAVGEAVHPCGCPKRFGRHADGCSTEAARADEAATGDTLPAWLYRRFMPDGEGWDCLDAGQRDYWEHQARAVRRAVARGGFKPEMGGV
jgi:hypothetical protein